jgi:hypothetical protein
MNKRFFSTYRGSKYIDGSFYPFLRGLAKKRKMNLRRLYNDANKISNVEGGDDSDDQLLIPASISPKRLYTLDWQRDKAFTARLGNEKLSFLRLISPENLYGMIESGYDFMKSECENNPNSKINELFW